MLIYNDNQPVFAGGSGCACSAVVTYGHFLKEIERGNINKILVVATGALMSPMSYQQKESIPSIAHAVSIEK
jgi:stage V sporulation protein AD